MSEYVSSANILHCGGEKEMEFIAHINKAFVESTLRPLTLEYTTFHEHQLRDTILFHDAQRYSSDDQPPMIVLMSKEFFELMWKSGRQAKLLDIITSEKSRCLHVWLDVSEEEVKQYSKVLVAHSNDFHRTRASELTHLSPNEAVSRLRNFLENRDSLSAPEALENYDMSDEECDMRQSFTNTYFSETGKPLVEVEKVPRKKPIKKKPDIYKDVLRLANMDPAEIEATSRERDRPPYMQTPSRHIPRQNTSRHPIQQNSVSSSSGDPEYTLSNAPRIPSAHENTDVSSHGTENGQNITITVTRNSPTCSPTAETSPSTQPTTEDTRTSSSSSETSSSTQPTTQTTTSTRSSRPTGGKR